MWRSRLKSLCCHLFNYHPTGCVRIVHPRLLMYFRCIRCLRIIPMLTSPITPVTSPVTPLIPGCFSTSPIPPGSDFPPPGVTGSFDSPLGYDLLDQATDLSRLSLRYFHFRMTCSFCRYQHRDRRRLCVSHQGGRLPRLSLPRGTCPGKDSLTHTACRLTPEIIH